MAELERWPRATTSHNRPVLLVLFASPGSPPALPARPMTTNTGAAAGAHPIELALVAGIAAAEALLVLTAAAIALLLALLPPDPGSRPPATGSAAGIPAAGVLQAPPAPTPSGPLAHPLRQLLADLPMAELRELCAAAGRRPGRSRTTALAALLA